MNISRFFVFFPLFILLFEKHAKKWSHSISYKSVWHDRKKYAKSKRRRCGVACLLYLLYVFVFWCGLYDGDVYSHLFGIMEFLRFFVISGECPSNCFGYLILGSLYCRMKSSYKVTFLRSLNNYFPNTVCFMYE